MADAKENVITVLSDHWSVVAGLIAGIAGASWMVLTRAGCIYNANLARIEALERGAAVRESRIQALIDMHKSCTEHQEKIQAEIFSRMNSMDKKIYKILGILESCGFPQPPDSGAQT